MGGAIAGGLLAKKIIKPQDLTLADQNLIKLKKFKNFKISINNNNLKACENAEVVILAVKPQILNQILLEIKPAIKPNQLIISVAIGITIKNIAKNLNQNQPIVRVMPNLAALEGASMNGWFANQAVKLEQKKIIKQIFSSIGQELELKKEADIDKITAISGSGPAYVFYLSEMLEKGARNFGFSREQAALLARQTIIGAAWVLKNSKKSSKELRQAVSSPGGTTEAAFKVILGSNFSQIFQDALKAAWKRSQDFLS